MDRGREREIWIGGERVMEREIDDLELSHSPSIFSLSVRPSVCLYFCISVCLSVRPSVCLSVCPSVCLSVYESNCSQF
jgi:hypothetical protein